MKELKKLIANLRDWYGPSDHEYRAADALEAQQAQLVGMEEAVDEALKQIKVQQARIAELREALEHYAEADIRNAKHYPPEFAKDALARADDLSSLAAHDAELLNDERRNPWKSAIIDAAVVGWTYSKDHDTNPRAAVHALLVMEAQMAQDPTINSDMAAHNAEVKEECAAACEAEAARWKAQGQHDVRDFLLCAAVVRSLKEQPK